MNKLRLKINPYTEVMTAFLNDLPLSPYSELNNYMRTPFLSWIDRFCEIAEREINDEYELIVESEEFEAMFLESLVKDDTTCVACTRVRFPIHFDVCKRYDAVKRLETQKNRVLSMDDNRLHICTEISVPENIKPFVHISVPNKAFVYINPSKEIIQITSEMQNAAIYLVISEQAGITCIGKEKFIWRLPKNQLTSVLTAIVERYSIIPYIRRSIFNMQEYFTEADRIKEFEVTATEPMVIIGEIKDIEIGNTVEIPIKTYPKGMERPEIQIASTIPEVADIQDNKLRAISKGNTEILFYRNNEPKPYHRQTVKVFSNNWLKEVSIELTKKQMFLYAHQKIHVQAFPKDADDINELVLRFSDESALEYNPEEETIKALKPGNGYPDSFNVTYFHNHRS